MKITRIFLATTVGLWTLLDARHVAAEQWAWLRAAPVPSSRTEVSVASDGSFIYLVGGFAAGRLGEPVAPKEVLRYRPSADTWDVIARISEGLNHAGLIAFDGKIFVIGGYRGAGNEPFAAVPILEL